MLRHTALVPLFAASAIAAPPALRNHVAVYAEGSLWVHGGDQCKESDSESDELWRFDFTAWTLIHPQGARPEARGGHVAVYAAGGIWIHGGQQHHGYLGDFWRYHVEDGTWSLQSAGGPSARAHHAAVYAMGSVWLHGGVGSLGTWLGDLWRFDLGAGLWLSEGDAGPSPRSEHTMVEAWGHLWLLGGRGATELPHGSCLGWLSDLWRFDPDSGNWAVQPAGPAPRSSHVALFDGKAIWMHGGQESDELWRFNGSWSPHVVQGSPSMRHSHVAVFALGSIWLHGGYAESCLDEVWRFDVLTEQWEGPTVPLFTVLFGGFQLLASASVFGLGLCLAVVCTACSWTALDICLRQDLGRRLRAERALVSRAFCLFILASVLTLAAAIYIALTTTANKRQNIVAAAGISIMCSAGFLFLSLVVFGFCSRGRGDSDRLAEFLVAADIRLVRFEFLEELHASGRLWPRRQEAESIKLSDGRPALLSHEEALAWAQAMRRSPKDQRIISISHCWETMQHADPWGFQLGYVLERLRQPSYANLFPGIFIDYISLCQYPRTSKQDAAFKLAMDGMHKMYSDEWTFTLCIPRLTPVELKDAKKDAMVQVFWQPDREEEGSVREVPIAELTPNATPYEKRGWCLAELQWSSLRCSNEFGAVLGTMLDPDQKILYKAPMLPAAFRHELAKSDVRFTHRSDFGPVVRAQRAALSQKSSECKSLRLHHLPAREVDILADSLQSYSPSELRLTRCDGTVPGLALRLSWVGLRLVSLQDCNLQDGEVADFAGALSASWWTNLSLEENRISDAGAEALAAALKESSTLQALGLRANEIGDNGAKSLIDAWTPQLWQLDLRDNKITAGAAEEFQSQVPDAKTLLMNSAQNQDAATICISETPPKSCEEESQL